MTDPPRYPESLNDRLNASRGGTRPLLYDECRGSTSINQSNTQGYGSDSMIDQQHPSAYSGNRATRVYAVRTNVPGNGSTATIDRRYTSYQSEMAELFRHPDSLVARMHAERTRLEANDSTSTIDQQYPAAQVAMEEPPRHRSELSNMLNAGFENTEDNGSWSMADFQHYAPTPWNMGGPYQGSSMSYQDAMSQLNELSLRSNPMATPFIVVEYLLCDPRQALRSFFQGRSSISNTSTLPNVIAEAQIEINGFCLRKGLDRMLVCGIEFVIEVRGANTHGMPVISAQIIGCRETQGRAVGLAMNWGVPGDIQRQYFDQWKRFLLHVKRSEVVGTPIIKVTTVLRDLDNRIVGLPESGHDFEGREWYIDIPQDRTDDPSGQSDQTLCGTQSDNEDDQVDDDEEVQHDDDIEDDEIFEDALAYIPSEPRSQSGISQIRSQISPIQSQGSQTKSQSPTQSEVPNNNPQSEPTIMHPKPISIDKADVEAIQKRLETTEKYKHLDIQDSEIILALELAKLYSASNDDKNVDISVTKGLIDDIVAAGHQPIKQLAFIPDPPQATSSKPPRKSWLTYSQMGGQRELDQLIDFSKIPLSSPGAFKYVGNNDASWPGHGLISNKNQKSEKQADKDGAGMVPYRLLNPEEIDHLYSVTRKEPTQAEKMMEAAIGFDSEDDDAFLKDSNSTSKKPDPLTSKKGKNVAAMPDKGKGKATSRPFKDVYGFSTEGYTGGMPTGGAAVTVNNYPPFSAKDPVGRYGYTTQYNTYQTGQAFSNQAAFPYSAVENSGQAYSTQSGLPMNDPARPFQFLTNDNPNQAGGYYNPASAQGYAQGNTTAQLPNALGAYTSGTTQPPPLNYPHPALGSFRGVGKGAGPSRYPAVSRFFPAPPKDPATIVPQTQAPKLDHGHGTNLSLNNAPKLPVFGPPLPPNYVRESGYGTSLTLKNTNAKYTKRGSAAGTIVNPNAATTSGYGTSKTLSNPQKLVAGSTPTLRADSPAFVYSGAGTRNQLQHAKRRTSKDMTTAQAEQTAITVPASNMKSPYKSPTKKGAKVEDEEDLKTGA